MSVNRGAAAVASSHPGRSFSSPASSWSRCGIQGFIDLVWCDPRLALDPEATGSEEEVFLEHAAVRRIDRIWWPDPDFVDQIEPRKTERQGRPFRRDGRLRRAVRRRAEEPVLQIEVARRPGYYLWKLVLPLVLLVGTSWIVFWLTDWLVNRRLGLAFRGVLIVVAFQFVIGGSLPMRRASAPCW